ncbi:sigma-70 family RNA polymerase sigma factor [Parendozoicomonas sp. Alg238-R29]|uniref:sigma-70 family RNA polymerase sigma factor n=1 Tax=Parendozoicomonas sp. Alg238-R29 TaxID=2993446 RepID=UPI00248E54B8|nr:sigma-70 family RNA polymerase sigma factor [Parendozoicomonas sp. Alg238-R29]
MLARTSSADDARVITRDRYTLQTRPDIQPNWQTLVEDHLGLVRRQARRIAEQIQRLDTMDDLLQAGFFGLVEAARRYDGGYGAGNGEFERFARLRIRGAMVDEIRRMDWRPRRISRSASYISNRMAVLEQKLGRAATEREMADSLGCSVSDYQKELENIECGQLESLIDEPLDSKTNNEQKILRQEQAALLSQGIDRLPVNEKQLLDFFYRQGMNQCEIAVVFQVTEARISQLHKQALLRLRAFMQSRSSGKSGTCSC